MPDGESFSPESRFFTSAGRAAGATSRSDRPHRRKRIRAFMGAEHRRRSVDAVGAADKERCALVQLRRLNGEHTLVSVGCCPARLFDDECEWTRFVKQSQFATLVL